jgi:hypothetical protein
MWIFCSPICGYLNYFRLKRNKEKRVPALTNTLSKMDSQVLSHLFLDDPDLYDYDSSLDDLHICEHSKRVPLKETIHEIHFDNVFLAISSDAALKYN